MVNKLKSTKIIDYGNIKVLEFNKMLEFKDKVEVLVALKTYNNGFSRLKNFEPDNNKYKNIAKVLNVQPTDIIVAKQSHTDNIAIIEKNKPYDLEDIDGIITNIKNIPTAITFADCTPIFFYDPIQNVIANIHSGWKGTVQKIAEKAIHELITKYNSKPQNIICLIGPCIRKDHFLVNDDVKDIFEDKFKHFSKKYDIIAKTNMYNEKGIQYKIDAVLINKLILKENGILDKNIIDSEICTVCNSNDFHSRRVEGVDYEVNTGLMMLK